MHRTLTPIFTIGLIWLSIWSCGSPPAPRNGAGGGGEAGVGGSGGTGAVGGPGGTSGTTDSAGGSGGNGPIDGGTGGSGGTDIGPPTPTYEPKLPEELAWLVDPAIWTEVKGVDHPECKLFTGDSAKLKFPALEWEACGEGCEKADVIQGYGDVAAHAQITTTTTPAGEETSLFSYRVSRFFHDGYWNSYFRLLDLATGETIASIRYSTDVNAEFVPCGPLRPGHATTLKTYIGDEDSAMATFDVEGRAWVWKTPWWTDDELPGRGLDCTSINTDDGRTIYPCTKSILGQLEPSSSAFTLLDTLETGAAIRGATQGDLVVWSEIQGSERSSRIRGWTTEGGIKTIVPRIPGETCWMSVSDTHIAGVSFEGQRVQDCFRIMENARFWVIPRTDGSYEGEVLRSPVLSPDPHLDRSFAVWGDVMAAILVKDEPGYPNGHNYRIGLSRFPDWDIRWLNAAEEGFGFTAVGVSSAYLYSVSQGRQHGPHWQRSYEVRRHDLEKIEAFTTAE